MAYTVKSGDTLGRIARDNGTTVAKLMELNPQIKDADLILVGWSLALPGEEGDPGKDEPETVQGGQELNNVPGRPEVWKVGDKSYLVYVVPGTEDDPVFLSWEIPSDDDLEAMFGPDQKITYNRILTSEAYAKLAPLEFGTTDELPATEKDPFASWESEVDMQSQTQPWILDDDYQALMAMAILEGRPLTQSEIKTTDWWQDHNSAQRAWMEVYHGDPKTAERFVEDTKIDMRQRLIEAGADPNIDQSIVDFLAMRYAHGDWSDAYVNTQITAMVDPHSNFDLDPELSSLADSANTIGSTNEAEDRVRNLLNTWLGPEFGAWSDSEVQRIAGKIRQDAEYEAEFIESLKDQRMSLFPEYGDRELSYQAIANTWKQWWFGQWGEQPDESSDLWLKVLKNNDLAESAKLLRGEGLKQGKKKVVDSFSGATIRNLGDQVREGIYV